MPTPLDMPALVRSKPVAQVTEPKTATKPLSPTKSVLATVQTYNEAKCYGFAVITSDGPNKGKRVYFHRSTGRVVIGNPDQPKLTTGRKKDSVKVGCKLIMVVTLGDKGLRSSAWGKIPTVTTPSARTWLADLLSSGLDCYVGGIVRSIITRGQHSRNQYEGVLADIKLSADKLTITLVDAEEVSNPHLYRPVRGGELELSYDLGLARLDDGPQSKGGYAILVIEGNRDRRISFNLPGVEHCS